MEGLIDQGMTLLTENFGPLGPLYAVAALGALLVFVTAPFLLRKRADPLDRLGRPRHNIAAKQKETVGRLRFDAASRLDKFAPYLEPKSAEELGSIRMDLMQAGYQTRGAVRYYYLARAAFAIGFAVIGLVYVFAASSDPAFTTMAIAVGGGAGIGYLVPSYWVTRRKQTRQREITNGFPDALDLMLVCVEAGQSLDQSMMRVAKEVRSAHPALADEFDIVSFEMRAGKDRPTVLRDMAQRTGVQDVASFVTVLVQSASFGTSIAEALRVYAAEMRDKRLMRAEEKANVLPTKLTLGTMMFTVPPLLLILIGPSIVDILRALAGVLSR